MQQWNPGQYAEHASFVSELGMPVVELLSPHPGERILDLGCGDGALSAKLAALGCTVVGVDASEEMAMAARARGVDAHAMDGQALCFDSVFDAVFSNAALHWMKENPAAVIDGVWRALRPGGRFVGEFGGTGNVAAIVAALDSALAARGLAVASPWFFPSAETYRALLEARGFVVESITLMPRPTPLPGAVNGWLETFSHTFLAALPVTERQNFIAEVADALRPALCDADGNWTADYVRLRFFALKPASAI